MKKIRNTGDMLFALYKAWSSVYTDEHLSVELSTIARGSFYMHFTVFSPSGEASGYFLSAIPKSARDALAKIEDTKAWSLQESDKTKEASWSPRALSLHAFIVDFWRNRI